MAEKATTPSDGTEAPAVTAGDGEVGPPSPEAVQGYHGDDAADRGNPGRPEDTAPFGAGFGKQKL